MNFSFVKRLNTEKDLTNYSKEKASKSENTAENAPTNAIDLLELKPEQGFSINGIKEYDHFFVLGSVRGAGDINNDGFNDIILSNPGANVEGLKQTGEVYIIFGAENIGESGNIDVNRLDGSNGFLIQGIEESSNFGQSISNAGDLNNDGIDDIIIGAPASTSANEFAGRAYVIFGDADLGNSGSLDIKQLDGKNGFEIKHTEEYRLTGFSVSHAGDVNGDDIDDLVIGSPFSTSKDIAKDYVVFGRSNIGSSGVLELSDINGENGFAIVGNKDNIPIHYVSSAGDVNGDGFDDLAIGAPTAGDSTLESYGIDSIRGESASGKGYVIYGSEDVGKSGEFNLSSLDRSNGFTTTIDLRGGFFGRSVSSAGDVNHDGVDDVVFGGTFTGGHVVFGNRNLTIADELNVKNLDGKNGFSILRDDLSEQLGSSVSSAGDFNNDGIDDLAIVAPNADRGKNSDSAEGYLIFGKEDLASSGNFELSQLETNSSLILQNYSKSIDSYIPNFREDRSSNNAVSNLGDINGDGIDDLIIGVPGGSGVLNTSNVVDSYVIFGNEQYGKDAFKVEESNSIQNNKLTEYNTFILSVFLLPLLIILLFKCKFY